MEITAPALWECWEKWEINHVECPVQGLAQTKTFTVINNNPTFQIGKPRLRKVYSSLLKLNSEWATEPHRRHSSSVSIHCSTDQLFLRHNNNKNAWYHVTDLYTLPESIKSTWLKRHIVHDFFFKWKNRGGRQKIRWRKSIRVKKNKARHPIPFARGGLQFGCEILKGQYKTEKTTCAQSFGTLGQRNVTAMWEEVLLPS